MMFRQMKTPTTACQVSNCVIATSVGNSVAMNGPMKGINVPDLILVYSS